MLDARLTPPCFAFEVVPTRAIASLLSAAPPSRLLLVNAPPGYGKTVTLKCLHDHWLALGLRCLWVTLDDRDRDVSDLQYLVKMALRRHGLVNDDDEDPVLSSYLHGGARMDNIAARLSQVPGRTVLFVDNLSFCRDPRLGSLLERLVFGKVGGLHLVLSSVEALPLDVVRAKLELCAIELRSPQLSFDRVSTQRLFSGAGIRLAGDDTFDRVLAQTEGWPAALRLLQILMSNAAMDAEDANPNGARSVLDNFGGDQRDMAQVLTRRVLVGLDPELVAFLLEVALVREFSMDLANHMTGRAEARRWIDLLLARNVLIFPLDRDRRWFRCHTLLREYLLAEGRQILPSQRRSDVAARAAQWHSEQGNDIYALEIALEAPAVELATRLIDRVAKTVAGDQGRMEPYIQWFERIAAFGGTPSLEAHAWYVWALSNTLKYERTRHAFELLDRRVQASEDTDPSVEEVHTRLSFLRVVINLYIDRLDDAEKDARAWLASGKSRDPLSEGTAWAVAGVAELERGALRLARGSMASSMAAWTRAGSQWGIAWLAILQACIQIDSARPDKADEKLREARIPAVERLGEDAGVVATLDFVHSRAMLDLGRLSDAWELARRGLARATEQGVVLTSEHGLATCLAIWTPDEAEGPSADTIDRVASSYPPRLQALLSAGRVRRLLEMGRASEAVQLARASGLVDGSKGRPGNVQPGDRGDWLLARVDVLVTLGRDDEALNIIDAQRKIASQEERHRDHVELWLAAAELHHRAGRPSKSWDAASQAIGIAAPGRLIQPFLRRPALLRDLLAGNRQRDAALIQARDRALLNRLMACVDIDGFGTNREGRCASALTARELQLLSLLDQGLSNQQVADRVSLSLTTVKWHLRNLYAKLEVGSRSAALAKARVSSMLPPVESVRPQASRW